MLTLQADLAGSAYEQTKWIYGVTTSGGSNVNSNDILASMQYPNKTTGNPSSSEQETYTVNALGQRTGFTDRNGNVHSYSFDVLGRPTSDSVTTLGSGVDGAVRRIDTTYDTQGNAYLLTSYSDTGGTTIVNQVQRAFNGLAQMTQEWQSHSGAVNTSTTPSVQYGWSLMSGGANHSRLTSITYPNGKVVNYNYNSGVDDSISRLSSLSDTSGTVESYSYLGLSTVVKRAHPLPTNGLDLTYITPGGSGDAGDQYTGLDRFGRIVDQKWQQNTTPNPTITDEFKYGYDRDSNRLYRTNEVNHSFDELYHANGSSNGYDNLNQLVAFARGTLNANHDTISSPSHTITWSLDALGNFSSTTTDGGSAVNNSFNKQNEETAAGAANLTFDNNGNTTTDDQGKTLVYDAWNRLVAYKNGGTTLESYKYDSLNHRIIQNPGTATDLYYSSAWQVLEERTGGVSTATIQYIWSPVYIDALILRDRSTQNNGTLDERLWVQQDANFGVTALQNGSGLVVERYINDPFGKPSYLSASWVTLTGSAYAWLYVYQGGRYYTISSLYSFRSRDLSGTLARWIQIDPLKFSSRDPNLYRAVANNPLIRIDPTGTRAVNPEGTFWTPSSNPLKLPVDVGIFFECTTFPLIASIPIGSQTVIYRLFEAYEGRKGYWQPNAWPNSMWPDVRGAERLILSLLQRYRAVYVDIFGWSRGGIEAMTLGHRLQGRGIGVRFMGLIDPVRTGGLQMLGTATSISTNVRSAFIAMAGEYGLLGNTIFAQTTPAVDDNLWWITWGYEWKWYPLNHQQIGWSNQVYDDMRAYAKRHGVPLQ
jgi:RHS repeat-associated protein